VFLFLLGAQSFAAPSFHIATKQGKPHLYFFNGPKNQADFLIQVLPEGQNLYHWTHQEWAEEVNAQQCITPKNMTYFQSKGVLKNFKQYGGFYVSKDMWDCACYGTELLILTLNRYASFVPFDEVFSKKILKAFGGDPIRVQEALVEAGIDGTFKHHALGKVTWMNIFNAPITQGIRMATKADFENTALNHSFLFEPGFANKSLLKAMRLFKPSLKKNTHFCEKLAQAPSGAQCGCL